MHEYGNPLQWSAQMWRHSPLDILVPAAIGLAMVQFVTTLMVLRSSPQLVAFVCLAAAAFASVQALRFLYRFTKDEDIRELTLTDFWNLFLPFVLSVALYAFVAPTGRLGIFVAAMSLPHFFALLYLVHRYARIMPRAASSRIRTLSASDLLALVEPAVRWWQRAKIAATVQLRKIKLRAQEIRT